MMELGSRNPYRRDRSIPARDERFDTETYDPRDEGHYFETGTDGTSRGRVQRRLVRDRSRSRPSSDESK